MNFLFALLIAGLTGLTLTPTAQARTLVEIKKSGVLRIVTEGAFTPFNYYEGEKLVCFEIDLAN